MSADNEHGQRQRADEPPCTCGNATAIDLWHHIRELRRLLPATEDKGLPAWSRTLASLDTAWCEHVRPDLLAEVLAATELIEQSSLGSVTASRLRLSTETKDVAAVLDQFHQRTDHQTDFVELDSLTGLYSRRTLDAKITQLSNELLMAVAVVDVDKFSTINHQYGHSVGDAALRGVAEVLRRSVCNTDLLSRFAGDQFLIVFNGADLEAATSVAEWICATIIPKLSQVAGQQLPKVTVSIGVAWHPFGAPPQKTVHAANQALSEAKRAGGNQVVVASAETGDIAAPQDTTSWWRKELDALEGWDSDPSPVQPEQPVAAYASAKPPDEDWTYGPPPPISWVPPPDDTYPLRKLVRLRERAGDTAGARALAIEAAKRGDTAALRELAWLRELAGDTAGAAALALEAAEHGDPGALQELAGVREQAGDAAGAEALNWQAANGGDIAALRKLALLREQAGDTAGARALAIEAADRGDTTALWTLAMLRRQGGDIAGAAALAVEATERGDVTPPPNLPRRAEVGKPLGFVAEQEYDDEPSALGWENAEGWDEPAAEGWDDTRTMSPSSGGSSRNAGMWDGAWYDEDPPAG